MTDANSPAFPHPSGAHGCDGLTKREWFAGMAMQAICAGRWVINIPEGMSVENAAAILSFVLADDMLAESEKGAK